MLDQEDEGTVFFSNNSNYQLPQHHISPKLISSATPLWEPEIFQFMLHLFPDSGEHKISFIPSMVGPFLEVTLVPESELRKATLHIFFDMMECEQKYHGNFKQVESELIDKLDILISENKGDDEYRQLFNTMWVPVTGHFFSHYQWLQIPTQLHKFNCNIFFCFCEPGNI